MLLSWRNLQFGSLEIFEPELKSRPLGTTLLTPTPLVAESSFGSQYSSTANPALPHPQYCAEASCRTGANGNLQIASPSCYRNILEDVPC